jgi:hypothetical protein
MDPPFCVVIGENVKYRLECAESRSRYSPAARSGVWKKPKVTADRQKQQMSEIHVFFHALLLSKQYFHHSTVNNFYQVSEARTHRRARL